MKIKYLTITAFFILIFVGCGDQYSNDNIINWLEDAHFINAVPNAELIKIDFPKKEQSELNSSALLAAKSNELNENKKTAQFYSLTQELSSGINNGVFSWLDNIDKITQYSPTAKKNDMRAWGPFSDNNDPLEYVFVIKKLDKSKYQHVMAARKKTEKDSKFNHFIISGHFTPEDGARRGKGELGFDLDAISELTGDLNKMGKIKVEYDTSNNQVLMNVSFLNFKDQAEEEQFNAEYDYNVDIDGNGEFSWETIADIDNNNPERARKEYIKVVSKWLLNGQGRSDVYATNGDLNMVKVYYYECWDENFYRVYYKDNFNLEPQYGDESNCSLK